MQLASCEGFIQDFLRMLQGEVEKKKLVVRIEPNYILNQNVISG